MSRYKDFWNGRDEWYLYGLSFYDVDVDERCTACMYCGDSVITLQTFGTLRGLRGEQHGAWHHGSNDCSERILVHVAYISEIRLGC